MSASRLVKKFQLPPMPSLSDLVKLHKLRAIRQLSQNYLLDKNINDKIIRHAGVKPNCKLNLEKKTKLS